MKTRSIYEKPELVSRLEASGLKLADLGCVMLGVEFDHNILTKGFSYGTIGQTDLYISENPDHWWITGDVTDRAHVTLRFGLLKPAHEQEDLVKLALDGWTPPEFLPIEKFIAFDSPHLDEPYKCIVAEFNDDTLRDAHDRLGYLPHLNTFAEYKPHATVAYVHEARVHDWLHWLNSGIVSRAVSIKKDWLDLGRKSNGAA